MPSVTIQFDYYEDSEEIRSHLKVQEYRSALSDIYYKVRDLMKHGDTTGCPEHIVKLLEEVQDMAWIE